MLRAKRRVQTARMTLNTFVGGLQRPRLQRRVRNLATIKLKIMQSAEAQAQASIPASTLRVFHEARLSWMQRRSMANTWIVLQACLFCSERDID